MKKVGSIGKRLLKDNFCVYEARKQSFRCLTSAEFMRQPTNEPILEYRRDSSERKALEETIKKYSSKVTEIPIVIGKDKVQSAEIKFQVMPHDHGTKLAKFSYATKEMVSDAIKIGLEARTEWERKPLKERAEIMLRAADLCADKYRMDLNASTMLGQSKTIIQAEIDAACELVDFLRFNTYSALQLEKYEPISTGTVTNRMIYRALEGFVAAISPFNFTAIGGNLASCPALMGNVVLWKPSNTAILSNYVTLQIFEEAGVPPGVINFLPANGPVFGDTITSNAHFAAINFTGSVPTFKHLWKQVAQNLDIYNTFPRLIGECGGKNFHFIHSSADLDTVAPCTIRSAFEYQGQKCSACSRMYVPESVWHSLKEKMVALTKQLKMDTPLSGDAFMCAVIDSKAFDRIKSYVDHAHKSDKLNIVIGGKYDNSKGFFVEPTIIETSDPNDKIMTEEIFGPILAVYPYKDSEAESVLKSVKDATPFGLTGAVFSQDKEFLSKARVELKDAVGNLYLNDKSTGSVVGQQPFGGARMSGTNDKAGGPHYCLKWSSPQTIKENSAAQLEWRYPSMD